MECFETNHGIFLKNDRPKQYLVVKRLSLEDIDLYN